MADEERRKFLKVATCAIGGGVGLVVAAPVLTLLGDPAGKTTVTTPSTPLDLGLAEQFRLGAEPRKVDIAALQKGLKAQGVFLQDRVPAAPEPVAS